MTNAKLRVVILLALAAGCGEPGDIPQTQAQPTVTAAFETSIRARSATAETADSSSSATPSWSAFHPTARYIAPLSTWR